MAVTIKLEGVEDVKRALRGKLDQYRQALEQVVAEAADDVRDTARREVPVGDAPFHVRDAIGIHQEGLQAEIGVFDRDAYYAKFVEFGTSKMRAKPFMQPAAEVERHRFADRVREAIK